MSALDPKIFFETDQITIRRRVPHGYEVRVNRTTGTQVGEFETVIRDEDFSQADQGAVSSLPSGTVIRRCNGYFSARQFA